MCNPAIFALALTAAGSAAQAAGARKAAKAMEGARIAESIRQKGFQSQADSINSESLSKSGRDMTDKGIAESTAARSAASDAAVADVRRPVEATGSNLAGDQTANKVMATEGDLAAAKNLNYATQQGRAKANMLSFNDVTFQNAINNIRSGQQLNTVGNFMRGSSNVLPIELEAASRQGDSLKTLGTTLGAAGSIVGMGAGAGWWDKAAATPTVLSSLPANASVTSPNILNLGNTPSFQLQDALNNIQLNKFKNLVPSGSTVYKLR